MSKELIFQNLKTIASAISTQFGSSCEIVLHDLDRPEHSIVFITRDVTGRRIGAPVTDFVLKLLASSDTPEDVINYISHTRNGRTLKSSTIFIRDTDQRPIGVFCINYDITDLIEAENHLTELTTPTSPAQVQKSFSSDLPDLLHEMIQDAMRLVLGETSEPAGVDKERRISVVECLEAQGVFKIRNSVPTVAEVFNVSRYTIYNDLKAIRAGTQEDGAIPD